MDHSIISYWKRLAIDDPAMKVIYLALREASKKWAMPLRNWKLAQNGFMIGFEDRPADYMALPATQNY